MKEAAERMMRIFAGFSGAHGTHGALDARSADGKVAIKATAKTLRSPVTMDLWEKHLRGERPLGVITIREDGTVYWACIDVDRYDLNLADVVRIVEQHKLPLVVCRSKSGGAHVFVFFSHPIPAAEARAKMTAVAAALGWGDCEIFPKQIEVKTERGDLGNWLNMPYLGGDDTERYGVKSNGLAMTLPEFLGVAEAAAIPNTLSLVVKVVPKRVHAKNGGGEHDFGDGPPCLEHLTAVGFPDHTRNKGLFALGVLCKLKFGEPTWREVLRRYNQEYLSPPLPEEEVDGLIRNLENKDYRYQCRDQPCASYCNAPVCRGRAFGIGGNGGFPTIEQMSKLESDPAVWFVTIEGHRLEFNSEQLQKYPLFHQVCMEKVNRVFSPMSTQNWYAVLGPAMDQQTYLEAPPEASVHGQFLEVLEEYLTDFYRGETFNDVRKGKPYRDDETGRYYFRLQDLDRHLKRVGFRPWGRNILSVRLKELGGSIQINPDGLGKVRVCWVPILLISEPPEVTIKASPREPI